ncbi:uncharacterized protein LOC112465462 isoform X2 [Temnothorax curvispinosus]|nr:uncharacterized protein LOC112465462 isoform X2 [Temnothorax curvispinosus]
MVAPDATEEDVRQSIGRAKTWEPKQQNESNLDLHEHMFETEETSILNESGKQSEASLTDVEDNSNNHFPDINNKKLVPYVKDSDDNSS